MVKPNNAAMNCTAYYPYQNDPAHCVHCEGLWEEHTQGARSAFFEQATAGVCAGVVKAVQDKYTKCTDYVPKHTWNATKDDAPECANCGKPGRFNHTPSAMLKGIAEFRQKEKKMESACNGFQGSHRAPGMCLICGQKWIAHNKKARTLVVERFTRIHQTWCKSQSHAGDHECHCMTDHEKQEFLDRVESGAEERQVVSCRKFRSKSPGVTKCYHCDFNFYTHSDQARDGIGMFQDWHARNMTDREMLEWFMSLPGKDRKSRIEYMRKFLTEPNFHHTPLPNKINPDITLIGAMLEAVTGEHIVGSPHKAAQRMLPAPAENNGMGTATLTVPEIITLAARPICYSCHEEEVETEGMACDSCKEYYFSQGNDATSPVAVKVDLNADN